MSSKIQIEKLPNGLTLVFAPKPSKKNLTMSLVVKAGLYNITSNLSGLPHFLEHMISTRSSKNRSDIDLVHEIDDLDISHNAETTPTNTCYMVSGDPSQFPKMFDILIDSYLNPKFDPKEISLEKDVLVEETRKRRDDPEEKLNLLLSNFLISSSNVVAETEEGIDNITRSDLVDYYNMFYYFKNVVIVFYGNFHMDTIKKQVKNVFSDLKFEQKFSPKFKSIPKLKLIWQNQSRPNISIKRNEYMHQTYTYVTFPYENIDDIAYVEAAVLMRILCLSAASRLYIQLRIKNGISYSVQGVNLEYITSTFAFIIYVVMNPESYLEGIEIILDEINKLRTKLIDEHDLSKAIDDAIDDFSNMTASNSSMANLLGSNVLEGKYYLFNTKNIRNRILDLTPEDLRNSAIKLFTKNRLNVITYGNLSYDKETYVKIVKGF
jgi:predicted Zn-dependent peptidase